MKIKTSSFILVVLTGAAVLTASMPLARRWREEARDRRVALAVEWSEVSDFNARLVEPDDRLLQELRKRGVSALVINPTTLTELAQQRRVQPLGPSYGSDPLDTARLRVSDPALARQLLTQWSWQNVPDLQSRVDGRSIILSRSRGSFRTIKDTGVGYDPQLLERLRAAGLAPIFRIYNDPWLQAQRFPAWLDQMPTSGFVQSGILLSSDEIPGGRANGAFWKAWLKRRGVVQFLPEFKPVSSAWQMAYALPANTFRAHTIPPVELKDLSAAAQRARWQRAFEERSCRLLLVRIAPGDSRDSFFANVASLRDLLNQSGWMTSFPRSRINWSAPRSIDNRVRPALALAIVCLTPFAALRWGRRTAKRWPGLFFRAAFGCLAGALVAAAVADTPYTRLQIFPFRGVKIGFLVSWLLSFAALYEWRDLRGMLKQYLRRQDILIAGVAAAALGYLLLRSGNAAAAWKVSWEQSLRNNLEAIFVARPRFKEFAIGHPALWVGCYLYNLFRLRRTSIDGRWLIGLGMIGPISMINTFCHLHSPLRIELWRSFNGLLLGVLIGSLLIVLFRRFVLSKRPAQISFLHEADALVYQRSSTWPA